MLRSAKIETLRANLHSLYIPKFDALCLALSDDWMPYQGWRSFVEQDALYQKGRNPMNLMVTDPSQIVTHAKAGESAHNWGCATDWTIFLNNEPLWDHDRWNEYAAGCKRSGLEWGGGFSSFTDKPHNELPLRVSWVEILKTRNSLGDAEAQKAIQRNIVIF